MIACSVAPATRRQYCLPPGVRSRLWLRGEWLPSRDAAAFLWLQLNDGRVLAFRLPADTFEHDGAIRELLEQVAEDHRGTLLEASLGDEIAIPLYAIPATPLPMLPWGDPRHGAARDFSAALDQEVLTLLASLNRHRCWDSLRNYNRLAALAPGLRERRLQALRRFPLLVAPILLSAHQGFDFGGGKRHAWRNHDDAVIEAVDRGRDLTGALARHYAISKGLARSPICASMWGSTALSHRRLLRLLDGIPAHHRPRDPGEFEQALPLLIAINQLADDATDLERLGGTAFRAGLEAVCAPLRDRYGDLGPALADCTDFLQAAADRTAQLQPYPPGLTLHRLQLAWIETRGFRSLLAASQRWHGQPWDTPGPGRHPDPPDQTRVSTMIGEYRSGGAQGLELCTAADLAREGKTMQHCVGQYWDQCRDLGTRIFALRGGTEQATAEYRFALAEARFSLAQLRGPHNARASQAMDAFARAVETELNALERTPLRAALAAALEARRPHRRPAYRPPRRLDTESERELATVLARLRRPLADGELVRDFVAGSQFHRGIALEPHMGVGDRLELVREPENPHDPLAVALRWRGEPIGYVPRRVNAQIARLLDAGEPLLCQITRIEEQADLWERVELSIRQVPAP